MARVGVYGCPFCRELYPEGETGQCTVCGVALQPMEKLPLSYEARVAQAMELHALAPEDRPLPWTYVGRGRGALIALSLLGIASFFAPWIDMTRPDILVLSGYLLARYKAGWFWGGAVAWFILIPLVATRRTIYQLRGIRIIATLFASMTFFELALLYLTAPQGSRYVPVQFDWGYGVYVSAATSLVGTLVAARLGGRLDDIEVLPAPTNDPLARALAESSDGQTVH